MIKREITLEFKFFMNVPDFTDDFIDGINYRRWYEDNTLLCNTLWQFKELRDEYIKDHCCESTENLEIYASVDWDIEE